MKSKTLILFLALTFSLAVTVNAQDSQQNSATSIISAYRSYKDIDTPQINVPTVVEVSFASDFIERLDFVVFDNVTSSFEPYFFREETLINEVPVSVSAIPGTASASMMLDKNIRTYADFLLPESTQGQAQITLSSTKPITASSFTALLDNNVALPNSVEVRAFVGGQNRIVVASRRMEQQTVHFPQTTSNKWQITFTYGQPLRISELRLNQDSVEKSSARVVRFLAQQGHSYRIYFDPDRAMSVAVGEAGNLASAQDVLKISTTLPQNNSEYVIADVDNDGIPDVSDNCVSLSNSDQQDVNNNGRGDVCDDFDQDGVINHRDNCPDNPNRDQRDEDSDGVGDVCDGEESRITEQYPWIPWVGMGFAAVILIALFVLTVRAKPDEIKDQESIQQ